ncbi:hypothetical protein Nepgr_003334 [Nepenthes gracilis]|uniref:Uncharacterized protein n=1 Tax=Nepenthes gracilis TaxID=150966 RepID=A0AAD3RZD6_NEPGR|nr:hypothetical protein Nepgr_003334 [Nepenthes gracilis]
MILFVVKPAYNGWHLRVLPLTPPLHCKNRPCTRTPLPQRSPLALSFSFVKKMAASGFYAVFTACFATVSVFATLRAVAFAASEDAAAPSPAMQSDGVALCASAMVALIAPLAVCLF